MGLDMFLNKRRFLWTEERKSEDILALSKKYGNGAEVKQIEFEAGYWRKANQIHKWFVDNVQGGEDDCKDYYVTREQLTDLLDTVNKVLANHDLAEELLPSQDGFFFGGTDYDEWYFKELEQTKEILDKILIVPADEDKGDYYYTASW